MAKPPTAPTTDLLDTAAHGDPVDRQPSQAIALSPPAILEVFERLALNKDVDVSKLQTLLAMQERILDRNAEAAFNAAFEAMQGEIPEIDEKGQIKNRENAIQSRYAKFEDIQRVIKPILRRHGFSLSFSSEWPDPKHVKLIGILTHRDGHERRSEFVSAADDSGSKNAIQGLGSATSYGRRYTTIDLLNITTRGADDDGQATGRANAPEPPKGYEQFISDLTAVADEGLAKLEQTFAGSKQEFREYLTKHAPKEWASLKNKARAIKSAPARRG